MTGILHEVSQQRFIGEAGGVVGALMFFYLSGTTDLAPIYTDAGLTTPLANPVAVAAGAILPDIYLDPTIAYRRRIVYNDGTEDDVDPLATAFSAAGIAYTPEGTGGSTRTLAQKIEELGVSIMDYGAIPNVDTSAAGLANNTALANAFAESKVVYVPGASDTYFAFNSGSTIPAGCTLHGDGAWLRMRGEGMTMGNNSVFNNLRVEGINPAVAIGTKGSGVPGRTSPTPDSPQYSLLTMNAKTGCKVYIPHIRNGLLNGMQVNNGSGHEIVIDFAENFGNDGVFSPTEGAIIYAPSLSNCRITIKEGAQTYALGAVVGANWSDMKFDLFIHDTRRAALHSAVGSTTGAGNEVKIRAYRLGGLAPTISSPPSNHNQTGCAVFWPGASRADYIQVIDPVVIDFAENAFEGTMTIFNPTVAITRTSGVFWDASYTPPNPGVFYGNQKVYGGTVTNGRGWILHAGGEEGAGVIEIVYDGVSINEPRPATINGVVTAPKFVHIQPVGSGNVADNITVSNIIGYDSSAFVTIGFYVQGTGGASFSNRCQVLNCRSTVSNNQIAPNIRQFGNSWNTLNNKSAPHYMGIDSEDTGGGFKRSYWGYGIEYSVALGSWRLDDLGTERTLICHGANSVQIFIIPRTVTAGALTNNDLQQYLVFNGNKTGFGPKTVTTATRPDAADGTFPGLLLYDTTIDAPIYRNAANTGWRVVTVT